MTAPARQYERRDAEALGEDYMRHVEAMTAERLHDKSDIAAELAFRDVELRQVRAESSKLWTLIGNIAIPIRRCFRDRMMPFAEFHKIAMKWLDGNVNENHPELDGWIAPTDARELRAELVEVRDQLDRAEHFVGCVIQAFHRAGLNDFNLRDIDAELAEVRRRTAQRCAEIALRRTLHILREGRSLWRTRECLRWRMMHGRVRSVLISSPMTFLASSPLPSNRRSHRPSSRPVARRQHRTRASGMGRGSYEHRTELVSVLPSAHRIRWRCRHGDMPEVRQDEHR
jgi:hypothetical protein